ncbi:hypothetical protein PENTCL1PPCAC_25559, partial [Pristionchus entomophagus]
PTPDSELPHAEMTSVFEPVSLATLPPDIVRTIVRSVGQPMDNMRLIAPVWNTTVVEYLADRRNQPRLLEVHFHTGGPEKSKDVVVKALLSRNRHYQGRFRGWTAAGMGDFMQSPTLSLRMAERDDVIQPLFFLLFIAVTTMAAIRIHFILSIVIVAYVFAIMIYLFVRVRPADREHRDSLAHIFSRFCIIETLFLHKIDRRTLDIVRETLGDVPITNLVIEDEKCDRGLRNKIVAMAQVHKCQKIIVCSEKCDDKHLVEFFQKATAIADEVEIYESGANGDEFFGKKREDWEKRVRAMSDASFSVLLGNGAPLRTIPGLHSLRFLIRKQEGA